MKTSPRVPAKVFHLSKRKKIYFYRSISIVCEKQGLSTENFTPTSAREMFLFRGTLLRSTGLLIAHTWTMQTPRSEKNVLLSARALHLDDKFPSPMHNVRTPSFFNRVERTARIRHWPIAIALCENILSAKVAEARLSKNIRATCGFRQVSRKDVECTFHN